MEARNNAVSFCNLIICSDQKVFAGAKIARNSLKIFSIWVVSLAKEEDGKKAPSASKVLVSSKNGNKYQVMPSKVDLAKEAGAIPLFFWVAAVEDEEDATMELHESTHDMLEIPFFRPKKQLQKGQQLTYLKATAATAGPKAKRQRPTELHAYVGLHIFKQSFAGS